jgi:hypothetical protein
LNLHHDFTDDPNGSPTVADSGQTALVWSYPDATAAPVVASGRYVINDTAAHTAQGAWIVPLSDSARITYAEAKFEMTPGTTAGQPAVVALWDSSLTRFPAQVVFVENGYYLQISVRLRV